MRSVLRLFIVLLALSATSVAAAEDHFFNSDDVRIRYIDRGTGEAVVLIHGFSRSIDLSWGDTAIIDALAPHCRVVALDCRGHGKSDRPHQADAYGIEMVNDIARLLDHLDIERAHIVGYSMGGRIALKFAAEHSERALSVTLIGSGGEQSDSDLSLFDRVAESLERGDGIAPLLEHIWPKIDAVSRREQMAEANRQTLAANDAAALAHVARGYRQWVVTDQQLNDLKMPVRAIIGSADPFRASVDQLQMKLPSVEVVELEGANHLTTLSNPAVAEHLTRLFDEQRDSPAGAAATSEQ